MNAIVTGASSGIGYELVKTLVRDQRITKVLAIARREDNLKRLKQECNSEKLFILTFDLSQSDHHQILTSTFFNGTDQVHLLVNNAGMLINRPFADLTDRDFETIYKTNVFAPVRIIRTLYPFLVKARPSHIVNIGSIGGFQGSSKFPGLSAYSSSKGALSCLSECLAEEFKEDGVNVNCLALGAVQTEMLQEAFPGYSAQLAPKQMAAYIADFGLSGHKYYNGKVLPVSVSTP